MACYFDKAVSLETERKTEADKGPIRPTEMLALLGGAWDNLSGKEAELPNGAFSLLLSLLSKPCRWIGMSCEEEGRVTFSSLRADRPAAEETAAPSMPQDWPIYDVALMNPPFGYLKDAACGNRMENYMFMHAVRSLPEDGCCTAILPNGFLGRDAAAAQELRRELCEAYHLTEVILLPASVFSTADVYTSILRVKNRREENDRTKIYDFRACASALEIAVRYEKEPPLLELTRAELCEHNYILLPEPYRNEAADDALLPAKKQDILRTLANIERKIAAETQADQLSLFEAARPAPASRADTQSLIDGYYDLLACELSAFLAAADTRAVPGRQLCSLKSGEKRPGGQSEGGFLLYGARGVCGRAPECNMPAAPTIIVGRVGSHCGEVFTAWSRGFLSHNAIAVTPREEYVRPEFLLLLLHRAGLNRFKRGTGQPYITHETIYQKSYALPDLQEQEKFLQTHRETLRKIGELERTLEQA